MQRPSPRILITRMDVVPSAARQIVLRDHWDTLHVVECTLSYEILVRWNARLHGLRTTGLANATREVGCRSTCDRTDARIHSTLTSKPKGLK